MKTLAQFKALNKKKGLNWFSKDTMQFWETKLETDMLSGKYFVTSEKDFTGLKRLYSVREANWETGRVKTVGEFQAHLDTYKAKQWLIKYCKENIA